MPKFGLAVYWGQVLEHTIVNMLVVAQLAEGHQFSADQIDDLFSREFRRTLGQLIDRARKAVAVPDELVRLLEEALELRNHLVHSYFRERPVQMATSTGRQGMIRELESWRIRFRETDSRLEQYLAPYRKRLGVTDEAVRLEWERLKREGK